MNKPQPTMLPVAWLVTDKSGYTSLHREKVRADAYAIDHQRDGTVDPLVKLSDATAVIVAVLEDLA